MPRRAAPTCLSVCLSRFGVIGVASSSRHSTRLLMLLHMTTMHSATSDVLDVHCRQPRQPQEIPEIRKYTKTNRRHNWFIACHSTKRDICCGDSISDFLPIYGHMSKTIQAISSIMRELLCYALFLKKVVISRLVPITMTFSGHFS